MGILKAGIIIPDDNESQNELGVILTAGLGPQAPSCESYAKHSEEELHP